MTNILVVLEILAALLSLVARATAAANQITRLIVKARSEGRDISNEELESLAADSDKLTTETLAALREAAEQ